MQEMTSLQSKVLERIKYFQWRWQRMPTMDEIARHFRWKSQTSAANHVNALIRKGFLEKDGRRFLLTKKGKK